MKVRKAMSKHIVDEEKGELEVLMTFDIEGTYEKEDADTTQKLLNQIFLFLFSNREGKLTIERKSGEIYIDTVTRTKEVTLPSVATCKRILKKGIDCSDGSKQRVWCACRAREIQLGDDTPWSIALNDAWSELHSKCSGRGE